MLRKFLKDYLDFSSRERKGIIALLALIVIIYLVPFVYPHFHQPPVVDKMAFEKEVTAFLSQPLEAPAEYKKPKEKRTVFSPTPFDPNTLSLEGWVKMGVQERTARSISRFVEKGGRFRKKEDLQKIYTLEKEEYERLLPYVRIPESRDTVYKRPFAVRKGPQPVDINEADSTAWEQLPGIGPGFAKRIVRFRERLGGFCFPEQVAETYGLPDSVFNKIQPFLRMGSISLRKIDLNHTDEKSLADHPYINTKLATQIIRYRSVHGAFRSVETLKELPLVDDIIYRKIENYITVN